MWVDVCAVTRTNKLCNIICTECSFTNRGCVRRQQKVSGALVAASVCVWCVCVCEDHSDFYLCITIIFIVEPLSLECKYNVWYENQLH